MVSVGTVKELVVGVTNTLFGLLAADAALPVEDAVEDAVEGTVKGDPSKDRICQSVFAHNTGTPSATAEVCASTTQVV